MRSVVIYAALVSLVQGSALAQAIDRPPSDKGYCGRLEWEIGHDLKQASMTSVSSSHDQAANYLASAATNIYIMTTLRCPVPSVAFGPDIYTNQAKSCSTAKSQEPAKNDWAECDQSKWIPER